MGGEFTYPKMGSHWFSPTAICPFSLLGPTCVLAFAAAGPLAASASSGAGSREPSKARPWAKSESIPHSDQRSEHRRPFGQLDGRW